MSVLIVFFTTVLLLLSAFVVLIILMQKPSANAGMGSALGGGAAEQAFGGDAANVLTRTTVFSIIGFFVLAFCLYLANLAVANPSQNESEGSELQNIASGLSEEANVPNADNDTPLSITADDANEVTTPRVDESEAVSLEDLESGETVTETEEKPQS